MLLHKRISCWSNCRSGLLKHAAMFCDSILHNLISCLINCFAKPALAVFITEDSVSAAPTASIFKCGLLTVTVSFAVLYISQHLLHEWSFDCHCVCCCDQHVKLACSVVINLSQYLLLLSLDCHSIFC